MFSLEGYRETSVAQGIKVAGIKRRVFYQFISACGVFMAKFYNSFSAVALYAIQGCYFGGPWAYNSGLYFKPRRYIGRIMAVMSCETNRVVNDMRQTRWSKHLLLAALWGCVMALPAAAERVDNLYRERVLVADQSDDVRSQAGAEALRLVLLRASGRHALGESEVLRRALAKPLRLIESFRYETAVDDDEGQAQTRLQMTFSQSAVEALLREAELPIWPENRPSVLMWLVHDDLHAGRQVVAFADEPELEAQLVASARQLGLPQVLPLLDLQDQLSLGPEQLWQLDQQAIAAASVRYAVDAILVGRYSQTSGGEWLASWSLQHRQQQQLFDSRGADLQALFDKGLGEVANHFSGIYGITATDRRVDTLVMEVSGVDRFQSYVALTDYLDSLAVLRHVQLLEVRGQSLRFALQPEGRMSLLLDALALDKRLKPETVVSIVGATQQRVPQLLRFYWAG